MLCIEGILSFDFSLSISSQFHFNYFGIQCIVWPLFVWGSPAVSYQILSLCVVSPAVSYQVPKSSVLLLLLDLNLQQVRYSVPTERTSKFMSNIRFAAAVLPLGGSATGFGFCFHVLRKLEGA